MANRTPVVAHDTVEELRKKIKASSDVAYRQRLKIIIAAKSGEKRSETAERLMTCERNVSVWVRRYNTGGSEALRTNKGGRPAGNPVWDAQIFVDLAKEIDTQKGYWSVPRMHAWITENKKEDIPEQTIWYRMDKLGYSYKSARPHPVQGNREKQAAFKKGASYRSSRL